MTGRCIIAVLILGASCGGAAIWIRRETTKPGRYHKPDSPDQRDTGVAYFWAAVEILCVSEADVTIIASIDRYHVQIICISASDFLSRYNRGGTYSLYLVRVDCSSTCNMES